MQKFVLLALLLSAAVPAHERLPCQSRLQHSSVRALLLQAYDSSNSIYTRRDALDQAQLLLSTTPSLSPAQLRYEVAALTEPLPAWVRDPDYVHAVLLGGGVDRFDIFGRADDLIDAYIDRLAGLDIEDGERRFEMRESGKARLRQTLLQSRQHPAWSFANPLHGWSSHYLQLRQILADLKLEAGQSFVDIGSGYGRLGLLMGLLYPDLSFTGYEMVSERVASAQAMAERLRLANVKFVAGNVANVQANLAPADFYFFYDSLNKEDFEYVLAKIRPWAAQRKIRILITHGSGRLYWQAKDHSALHLVRAFPAPRPFGERAYLFEVKAL